MNLFLTLEELKQYQPKKDTYFVFGSPISHSLSPKLHQAYFAKHQLDGDYIAVKVEKHELKEAIDCIKGYAKGVNLTIPLKEAVIELLDEIDPRAERIGAVNTLLFTDGKIKGFNTDYYGVISALAVKNISLADKKVLILGNGGVCKAFLAAASDYTDDITVAGRSMEKVTAFCQGTKAKPALLSEVAGQFDIVLNGTSAGMGEQMSLSPLSPAQIKTCGFLFDSIYNPFDTNLLTLAKAYGKTALNGLYMLVYQGLKAQEIWGNPVADEDAGIVFDALKNEFTNQKKNIILIGYMGSGKTTVGKLLSRQSGMPFYDMDALLEDTLGQKISDIFSTKGEVYFRQQETGLAQILSRLNGAIISTGGGIIKNPENIRYFKENGTVCFLHPPLSKIKRRLQGDTTRPLLQKPGELERIYEERLEAYLAAADITVTASDSAESAGEILGQIS